MPARKLLTGNKMSANQADEMKTKRNWPGNLFVVHNDLIIPHSGDTGKYFFINKLKHHYIIHFNMLCVCLNVDKKGITL